jgi:PmbA protein
MISNSHQCGLERISSFASAQITVKAEDAGRKGQSSESVERRSWGEIDFLQLAEEVSERAVSMMDAKLVKSRKTNVIWRNKLFAKILRIMFGRTLSADSVQKNRSPWKGKIGTEISSEDFNLLDDGVKKAGMGTREFDDEGHPQQETPLITQGILRNYIYDNYTAKKEGKESTGNASRSYRSIPTPIVNNLTLIEGKVRLDELIQETKHGIYILEVIGDWLSNPISGDVSATVTNSYLIEEGELAHPVKGIIVSTNFFTTIKDRNTLMASDTENSGSSYSPSVKIRNVTLTGT